MENRLFKVNEFSENFKKTVAKNVFLLKFLGRDVTGGDWEDIVRQGMKAEYVKGNEKLADVKNEITAWSCKTLGSKHISNVKTVDVISGRFDITSEYKIDKSIRSMDAKEAGNHIIKLWNKRVFDIGNKYNDLRNIILLRNKDLSMVLFYEELSEPYDPNEYEWKWNYRGVLEGYDKIEERRKFSFQPSGTQFRIRSDIPEDKIVLKIGNPNTFKIDDILKIAGYDEKVSFREITNNRQMEFSFSI